MNELIGAGIMKRDEWEVNYTGSKLEAGAQAKKEYHSSRVEWWMKKKEEVLQEIRSKGITVTESIVDELAKGGYSNTSNAHNGPTVQIDAGLQAHLREAQSKVTSHKALVTQYDAWIQMMSAHPENVFSLTHDDWMFFFGK